MVDRIDVNPWTPPRNKGELLEASPPKLHEACGRQLITIRVLCGVLLGIPAICLFPFATWLAVASILQLSTNSSPFSLLALAVAGSGIAGFFCLWWFVLFGLHAGVLGVIQITGIAIGVLIMLLVISIQLSQFY